jgi:hypothetical protein
LAFVEVQLPGEPVDHAVGLLLGGAVPAAMASLAGAQQEHPGGGGQQGGCESEGATDDHVLSRFREGCIAPPRNSIGTASNRKVCRL